MKQRRAANLGSVLGFFPATLGVLLLIVTAFFFSLSQANGVGKGIATQSAIQRPIRIVAYKPTVKEGTMTAATFLDRLVGALRAEAGVEIGTLDVEVTREALGQIAAEQRYDFILYTIISGVEDKSLSGKTVGGLRKFGKKIPGMKEKINSDLKFTVTAEYTLQAVRDTSKAFPGKGENTQRSIEDAVGEVLKKLTTDVMAYARQTIVSLPAPPAPVGAPTPGTAAGASPRKITIADPTSANGPRLVVQTTHSTMVTDFVYSTDGGLLATLSSDGIVKLWNTQTGIEINTFSGYRTVGIAISPDAKLVAALGKDGVIRLFETTSGRLVRRLEEISRSKPKREKDAGDLFNHPISIAFGPSGNYIANGGEDGIKVWDVASGRHLRNILKGEEIPLIALSPDGTSVAAVKEDNIIEVRSTSTGKEIKEFHSKVGRVTALVFSQNGQSLICGSRYGTVRVFDISKGDDVVTPPVADACDKPFEGEAKLGFGRKVPGVKGTFKRVTDTCDLAQNLGNLFKGRLAFYYESSIRSLALHPQGNVLAWSAGDNTVHVTDLKSGKELYSIASEAKTGLPGIVGAVGAASRLAGAGQQGGAAPRASDTARATGGDQKASLVIAEFFRELAPVKFSTDGKTLSSVREFKTIGRWDAVTGQKVSSLALSKRDLSGGFPFPIPWGSVPIFGRQGDILVTGSLSKGTKLWDLKSGMTPIRISGSPAINNKLPISDDSRLIVEVQPDTKDTRKIVVKDAASELEVRSIILKCVTATPEFSPDGKYLAVTTYQRGRFFTTDSKWLHVFEIASGKEVYTKKHISHFEFSDDGKLLGMRWDKDEALKLPFSSRKDDIRIVKVGDPWEEIFKEKAEDSETGAFSSRVIFNSDGSLIASTDLNFLKVWEVSTGKVAYQRELEAGADLANMVFQPGKNVLTYTTYRRMYHWDLTAGKVKESTLLTDFWGNLSYSADGKTLALGGAENRVRLFDVEHDHEIGSLIVPSLDDWMVVTADGRLDTSRLEEVEEVHWMLPDEPFLSQPIELFMRDYYEPRLLSRLISGDSFAEVGDLTKRNRTLPEVVITNIASSGGDSVQVTVATKNAFSKKQFDAGGRQLQSGGADLRLFRDGQLVGYVDGAIFKGGASDFTQTFTVRLPHPEGKAQFEFTAYAFNDDRVKSLTAKKVYEPATPLPPMKGKVYMIGMGANTNENPNFTLRFAANDVRRLQSELPKRLRESGRYAAVIEVPLISDRSGTGRTATMENNATKAAFQAVLDVLAGRRAQLPPEWISRIPNGARLARVTPDDLVLISFSGHGYTDAKGVFYMVPSDISPDSGKKLAGTLQRCISSDELSLWLRDVDAAEMMMIVDACYSAAAIEGNEFKPGPMGSRGLGQLSYDKGMRILAATQKENYAIEVQQLEHGLLTYALVRDGIESKSADHRPTDKKIMATEWLRYGVKRVPELYEAAMKGNLNLLVNGKRSVERLDDELKKSRNPKETTVQMPALFDFLWKREDRLMISLQSSSAEPR